MADKPEKVYNGIIVNFGKGDGDKGSGFGFVEAHGAPIADAYFNMPMLERQGFPIPSDVMLLNGLRVKYTVGPMPDGVLRVTSIQLDDQINYEVRRNWQGAAPEVAAQTAGDQPQRAKAETPTDVQHINIPGHVKWFDDVRGYGFIKPDDGGKDVMVHFSVLGDRVITTGDRVTFDRIPNLRKGREGSWITSAVHTINGKASIPNNIPNEEIYLLNMEVREFQDGLRFVLPAPYLQFNIPVDLKGDAAIFASYPEYRIDAENPLEAGERLEMRVWIKHGEVMLLPKNYPQGAATRPAQARTPGGSKPTGNEGQR